MADRALQRLSAAGHQAALAALKPRNPRATAVSDLAQVFDREIIKSFQAGDCKRAQTLAELRTALGIPAPAPPERRRA